MEKSQSHKTIFTFILILNVQFFSLVLPSSVYTLPDQYFINCGSDSGTKFGNRLFVGDNSFFKGPDKTVKSSNSTSGTPLYQTARVFYNRISSYEFNIEEAGIYMIRFHFFIFSSPVNLTGAVFDVWAGGFSLLSNFRIPENSTSTPVLKDYLLTLTPGIFRIDFMRCHKQSFAFVNAIEVFLVPEGFLPNVTTHLTSVGNTGNYTGLPSKALHSIYRINVGGGKITAENDTMLRNWIPDDDFLTSPAAANNSGAEGSINFQPELASEFIAPVHVYKTAKVLNTGGNYTNITWSYKVSENAQYLVRVHFYDIVSSAAELLKFNLHINSKLAKKIDPYDVTGSITSPFYFDFVVDSDGSELLNLSVGLNPESMIQNALLNGLEIMAIMENKKPEQKRPGAFLGGSIGGFFFVLILIVVLLVVLKIKGVILTEKTGKLSLEPDVRLALRYSYAEIRRATKNFDSKFFIARGGFGKVYKGTLANGVKVAVKRSEPGHGQGLKEFETEITVLSRIRHRHLVELYGYCDARNQMILVYEYMETGTLRDHLYFSPEDDSDRSCSRSELTWEQRLQICIQAARGLHYLHTGLRRPIIHGDVKSTNILLDKEYIAKVADFGLSRSGPPDPDNETTGIKGSVGYLDPEYVVSLQLTEKSDVYSFGVVLLEVLCARPAIITSTRREETSLAEWGMLWLKKGQLEHIIDPCLVGKIKPNSLRKFAETAEKCLSRNGEGRPDMRDVLWDLEVALHYQQGVTYSELQEDSLIDASLEIPWQVVQHIPSQGYPVKENDPPFAEDDGPFSMASGVFSQLGIGEGR